MLTPLDTFLGFAQDTVLLITVIVAAIATFGSMLFILFFAFAPYVSESWDAQFGAAVERANETESE